MCTLYTYTDPKPKICLALNNKLNVWKIIPTHQSVNSVILQWCLVSACILTNKLSNGMYFIILLTSI